MSFKTNLFRFISISVLGVLLHFTYEWSNQNPVVGLFSAVNESTWEHLKLLFFPMLLLTISELLFMRSKLPDNYLQARTLGILCGMLFIITAFYTFWGVIGKAVEFINIAIYFLGVIVALLCENRLYNRPAKINRSISAFILILLTLAFFVFTYHAPDIGLFYDLAQ